MTEGEIMPSILLTGPAAEPITLAEAKQFLRVEHDDDDDVIAALIAGSRIHVETQTRRALITQSWRLTRDAWPDCGWLAVLPVPLRTLDAARVYRLDGSTLALDVAGFAVDKIAAPARLAFTRGALPRPGGRSPASRLTSPAAMASLRMCPSRCDRRSGSWSRTGTRTADLSPPAVRSRCCRKAPRR
jgi:hypothetical protein